MHIQALLWFEVNSEVSKFNTGGIGNVLHDFPFFQEFKFSCFFFFSSDSAGADCTRQLHAYSGSAGLRDYRASSSVITRRFLWHLPGNSSSCSQLRRDFPQLARFDVQNHRKPQLRQRFKQHFTYTPFVLIHKIREHRWLPFYPNMDNPNSCSIRSPLSFPHLLSRQCQSAYLI